VIVAGSAGRLQWARGAALMAVVAAMTPAARAQREAVPLNDYTRLGQRFTAARPFLALWVTVPSWMDAEGGLTLTLWDTPARRRALASKVFTDVADNASVEIRAARPFPAGVYYWEVGARTGVTKVGLYADPVVGGTDDCAFLDGAPDRSRKFVFSLVSPDFVRTDIGRLLGVLRTRAAQPDKAAACRELAVTGNTQAVPHLAALLSDPELSHMARYALEVMPYASAGAALRKALRTLKGDLLIGVMNSIGVRRDDAATPGLADRLTDANQGIASASAAALGRIGSDRAALALRRAFGKATGSQREALADACLECGRIMTNDGRAKAAVPIFDLVCRARVPSHLRAAALRGAISARGVGGVGLLLDNLRGGEPWLANAALWLIPRDLPGSGVTRKLANALPTLEPGRQALLVAALAARRDPTAFHAIVEAARTGHAAVRLAAIGAMSALGGAEPAQALVDLVGEPDASISGAARDALAKLPNHAAEVAAAALLARADTASRTAAIELASQRGLRRMAPRLIETARGSDPETRLASLRALRGLAGGDEIADLLSLTLTVAQGDEADAAEQALVAACRRSADVSAASLTVARALSGADPSRMPALIRVLGSLGGETGLSAVRANLGHADAQVRAASLDALCEWPTADAAPDLLRIARLDRGTARGFRCIRGLLRVAGLPDLAPDARLALCVDAAGLITRDEERRVLLGALGGIPLLGALELAVPHLASATTRAEACEAVVGIAARLGTERADPRVAAALAKVAAYDDAPDVARRAAELLAAIRGGAPDR